MFAHFRPRFKATLVGNVGMTQTRGNRLLADEFVDLVAFGQAFIANPDLPERFAADAPLAVADHTTFYTPGPHGYTDYVSLLPCNH
jgi:N-ethylmaleimide reductase